MIMDELLNNLGAPEDKIKRYQACVNEFDQLNFDDVYIRKIRNELISLEKNMKRTDTR
ncbi:hypothetical protein HQQ94_15400 [Shewanella sp. VB17]|uniref:hypothetical protein n=1 Tax=Shewanella sp. VB17 TaxID=2739432 RepID=UPI0015634767|nr:hypothetical protein [Shewanella sp. VB17]NRD74598.1 hypothetical protein [Shewanella sp. VB17]